MIANEAHHINTATKKKGISQQIEMVFEDYSAEYTQSDS